ncbi:hypothetical protein BHE74_00053640 [Ensete ventricosum]|nr:hypothetical protein BHE74_00053640 [Ensete ventricosum]
MAQSRMFQEEEEDLFFDSREDVSSVFDSCPGSPAKNDSFAEEQFTGPQFEVWLKSPHGVRERRDKFMRWMGKDLMNCSLPRSSGLDGQVQVDEDILPGINRSTSNCCDAENKCSMRSWSNQDASTSCNEALEENMVYRIKNLDDGAVFTVDELGKDSLRSLRKASSNKPATLNEPEKSLGPSSIPRLLQQEENTSKKSGNSVRRKWKRWLQRLNAVVCIVDKQSGKNGIAKSGRVEVRQRRKQSKKLSAVYKGQDIKAHDGAILTMKFSPDGRYLATGGADGIVRVWHAMECERKDEFSIPDDDPSCLYFTVNHNAELTPVRADKEKMPESRRFCGAGSRIYASFTADGQHIVSASDDSNVYFWNHASHTTSMSNHVKSTRSCERFFSKNTSIAIPWHGLESNDRISVTSEVIHSQQDNSDQAGVPETDLKCQSGDSYGNNTLYLSPSGSFTLSHEFFSEFSPKGSVTWPEEKLPSISAASTSSKAHHKFLKTSFQNTSHAWGQVILTAGWDGWIKSYQNYGLPVCIDDQFGLYTAGISLFQRALPTNDHRTKVE